MADITTAQAAAILKVSERQVRRLAEGRLIDGDKIGRDWFVTRESVREYAKSPRKRGWKPGRPRSKKLVQKSEITLE